MTRFAPTSRFENPARGRVRALSIAAVLLLLVFPSWSAAQEIGSEEEAAALFSDMAPDTGQEAAEIDPGVRETFVAAYEAETGGMKGFFGAWLEKIGSRAILDLLEEMFPKCHGQSHDLGKAIYLARDNVSDALVECGTRCTSGCMHGVLMEAFGSSDLDVLKEKSVEFCFEGTMAELHKPGNCAHGIGHAFMAITGNEVDRSLDACRAFPGKALPYYCATGVYMELLLTGADAEEQNRALPGRSIHHPCDVHEQFPAACYRYRGSHMVRLLGDDVDEVAEACFEREGAARRGCFHGIGKAHTYAVYKDPASLAEICGHGDADDRALCIEGVIEKLADYDESKAAEACAALDEADSGVCASAAEGKMYRLEKATMPLYWQD